jgi:tetratricopeptide (TPR) repeat protein
MKRLIFIVLAIFICGCATSEVEKNSGTYYRQGVDWEGKGDHERAIANYSRAIELDPKFAEAYFGRGADYVNKGLYDNAISDCTRALELNPKLAEAYYGRGSAYYFKGEYDKAWEDVHKSQSLYYQVDPRFLEALREASGRQK